MPAAVKCASLDDFLLRDGIKETVLGKWDQACCFVRHFLQPHRVSSIAHPKAAQPQTGNFLDNNTGSTSPTSTKPAQK